MQGGSIPLDPDKRHRVCVCRNIVTTIDDGSSDPPGLCRCIWTDELDTKNNGSCMTATVILIILTVIGIAIMLYSVSLDSHKKFGRTSRKRQP